MSLPIPQGKKRKLQTPETAYNVGRESSYTSNTLHSSPECKYDVFLSFAGNDTRLNFTGHLYEAFSRSGIRCFRDDVDLPEGEDINYLFQAIRASLCAVLVISENYAKSQWCLDELLQILESQEKLDRRVFPIFYNVNPADVRKQRESFGKAFAKLEKEFKEDTTKVQNWRTALSNIGRLSGCVTEGKHEAELIKVIVGNVSTYLNAKIPSYDDNLVGIESRVRDIRTILEMELDEKCVVGIWGMGGVGKTTLARVVYKQISRKFDVCCFIANVRDTLQREGLVSLQEKLLSDFKGNKKISDRYEGEGMIRKYLSDKKVLLVLDDVDNKSQLDNLAENPNWFGKGSRILITTRDSSLLVFQEQRMYDMKTMSTDESLQLFSKKAFLEDYPKEDYLDLSKSFVEYAGGLPLALKVLGSYLHKRKRAEWREALDILKQFPNNNIVQVLQISYDGLNAEEKTMFLDIACFFKGWLKREVSQILKSYDLHPTIGIKVLIEKALLVETKECRLEMHNLIEKLGRDLVHQESPEVCKRSRLWKFKDIKKVLENNKGSEAIQAIAIKDNYEDEGRIQVHPEAFSKMSSIRLLLLKDTMMTDSPLILPSGFKLPGTLRVVQWPSFPLKALPLETLNELVHVKMHDSRIKKIGNLIQPMKMKFIDLSNSKYISRTPNFSGVPRLKHLCLRGCIVLVKVHRSIGELKELVEVDLHGCSDLETLPSKLETNLLRKLDLGGCIKVVTLPQFGKGMDKLSYLDVSDTSITSLPESFGSLTGLRHLNLSGCQICNLEGLSLEVMSLTELYLRGCGLHDGSILDVFGSLSSLIILDLSRNNFDNLPTACFSGLSRLLFLSLESCRNLRSLPPRPPQLIRLNVSNCDSMEPLSSDRRQLLNLVPSLDHEYRGQTEYVISDEESEEYDDTPSIFKRIELEPFP